MQTTTTRERVRCSHHPSGAIIKKHRRRRRREASRISLVCVSVVFCFFFSKRAALLGKRSILKSFTKTHHQSHFAARVLEREAFTKGQHHHPLRGRRRRRQRQQQRRRSSVSGCVLFSRGDKEDKEKKSTRCFSERYLSSRSW